MTAGAGYRWPGLLRGGGGPIRLKAARAVSSIEFTKEIRDESG